MGDSLKNPEKYFKTNSILDQFYIISKRSFEIDADIYPNKLERYVNCPSGIYKAFVKNNKGETSHLKFKKSHLYDLYCASIHCKVFNLKIDESAIIRLRFRLWASTLALVIIFVFLNQ